MTWLTEEEIRNANHEERAMDRRRRRGAMLRCMGLAIFSLAMTVTALSSPARCESDVTISWEQPPTDDLAGFRVRWGLNQDTPTSVVPLSKAAREYTISDLADGIWWASVEAVDTVGQVNKSDALQIVAENMGPPAPVNLKIKSMTLKVNLTVIAEFPQP